jgi:hypothetical protein
MKAHSSGASAVQARQRLNASADPIWLVCEVCGRQDYHVNMEDVSFDSVEREIRVIGNVPCCHACLGPKASGYFRNKIETSDNAMFYDLDVRLGRKNDTRQKNRFEEYAADLEKEKEIAIATGIPGLTATQKSVESDMIPEKLVSVGVRVKEENAESVAVNEDYKLVMFSTNGPVKAAIPISSNAEFEIKFGKLSDFPAPFVLEDDMIGKKFSIRAQMDSDSDPVNWAPVGTCFVTCKDGKVYLTEGQVASMEAISAQFKELSGNGRFPIMTIAGSDSGKNEINNKA